MARIAWLCISVLLCGAECLRISTTDPDCCWVAGSLYGGSLEDCTPYPGVPPLAGMKGNTCNKKGAMSAIKERFEQVCGVLLDGDQFQFHVKENKTGQTKRTRLSYAFHVRDFFESLKTFPIDNTGLKEYRKFGEVKHKVTYIVTNFEKNNEPMDLIKLCNKDIPEGVCVSEETYNALPDLCQRAELARTKQLEKAELARKKQLEDAEAQEKSAELKRLVKAELEKRVQEKEQADLKARAEEDARKKEQAELKSREEAKKREHEEREEAKKREHEERLNKLKQYPGDGLKEVVSQALTLGWSEGGAAAEILARALVSMYSEEFGGIAGTYAKVAGLIKEQYDEGDGVDTEKLENMLSGFLGVSENSGYVAKALANYPIEKEEKFLVCCAFTYAQKKPEGTWDADKCKIDKACSKYADTLEYSFGYHDVPLRPSYHVPQGYSD